MTKNERRVLGALLYEMRNFNRYHTLAPQVQGWIGTLAKILQSHAQPDMRHCPLCGAGERWQNRRELTLWPVPLPTPPGPVAQENQ